MKAAETTIPAWKMAVKNRPIEGKLIFHRSGDPVSSICLSCVYGLAKKTPDGFAKYDRAADAAGKETAASAVRWDNAVAESFFKTLKSELVYQQVFQSRAIAKQSVFEYVEIWYNRQRRHSALGYLSPFDYYNGQLQNVA